MKHIFQEHKYGCGIACLAIILSKSYDEIHQDFPTIDFNKEGLIIDALCAYLGDNGFSYIKKSLYKSVPRGNPRDIWPPELFAPIHIVQVDINSNPHYVILYKDEKIYCPAGVVKDLNMCSKIYCMVGLYKVNQNI